MNHKFVFEWCGVFHFMQVSLTYADLQHNVHNQQYMFDIREDSIMTRFKDYRILQFTDLTVTVMCHVPCNRTVLVII
jgi:hypothetical protein